MAEEEEIGQEFDRVIRASVMAFGQAREGFARHATAKNQEARDAAATATRQQEAVTLRLRESVSRESFWTSASGERIANAATYGATLYNTDHNAAAVYDTVRETAWGKFGINVDALRSQFPDSEEQRRNALLHAVDDRLAAMREDALSREDRAQSADLGLDSNAERQRTEELLGQESPAEAQDRQDAAEQLQDASDQSLGDAVVHEGNRDRHGAQEAGDLALVGAASQRNSTSATPAAAARQKASASYPTKANAALAQSRSRTQPKARAGRHTPAQRGRDSGLSR